VSACRRIFAAAALIFLAPTILTAHARLLRSWPAAGERLASSPLVVRLVFSEMPVTAVSHIMIMGAPGDSMPLRMVRTDPADRHALIGDLPTPLAPGAYRVHWSTAASDGHPSSGTYYFTVLAGREAPPLPVGPTGNPSPPSPNPLSPAAPLRSDSAREPAGEDRQAAADAVATSYPMGMARWVGLLALFFLIGSVAFKYAILGRVARGADGVDPFVHIASVNGATFGMIAAFVLLIASAVKLYAETVGMPGVPFRTILLGTSWGWALLAQIAACIVGFVAFAMAHRENRLAWPVAALCAVVLAVTPALTGHAIGSDDARFTVPLDILHVAGGSVWLGTLAVIVFAGIGAAFKAPGEISPGSRVAAMINTFSPLALLCAATVVCTGVIASLLNLDGLSRLWTSDYGLMLLRKLVFVTLLLAAGAWNWRRMKPRLGTDGNVRAIQRSARLELALGAIVLAFTAFLVALALPD
jgi:copper transport protein